MLDARDGGMEDNRYTAKAGTREHSLSHVFSISFLVGVSISNSESLVSVIRSTLVTTTTPICRSSAVRLAGVIRQA